MTTKALILSTSTSATHPYADLSMNFESSQERIYGFAEVRKLPGNL